MKTTIYNLCAAARKLTETAAFCGILATAAIMLTSSPARAQFTGTTPQTQPFFPLAMPTVSTVPGNGDVNPYGVFFTPRNILTDGILQPGDILVSNFNNNQNLQGTGTTIIRVPEHGPVSTFYQGQKGLGLTAALGVVSRGVMFVGNLPTIDGTSNTIQTTSLLVIDRKGKLLGNLTDKNLVAGPWGMAINDQGGTAQVFFSNVLNGTVTRLDLAFSGDGETVSVRRALTVAQGYNHRTDPAALVLGPSGLFYDARHDILYVASSADNAIYAVPDAGSRGDASAGTGTIIYQDLNHLHGPLDLVMAPNGHLLVANSDGSNANPNDPSELVEFTVTGQFIAQYSVDPNNGGAFGIGITTIGNGAAIRFAAVDDNMNTLTMWTTPVVN
ncbi:MAG TPA: hypothetical protein VMH81_03355 [Bryobacteraceae bacterium]|nr:hypothetical protein [Bryobacteraceae bacterium]